MYQELIDWIIQPYSLLIVGIIIITMLSSYIHNNGLPIFWGLTLGLVLYYGKVYIEPLLINWYSSTVFLTFWMGCLFCLSWFFVLAISLKNCIVSGEVTA